MAQPKANIELNVARVAGIVYMACREYDRKYAGDYSATEWDKLPQDKQDDVCAHVLFRQENRGAPTSAWHNVWWRKMFEAGYVPGNITDHKKKTHADMKPFELLPQVRQDRERLFVAVVEAMS